MAVPVIARVLGPLEIAVGGSLIHLNKRQQCLVFFLLLTPNCEVPMSDLLRALWGEDPPPTARNQVQIIVSGVRRMLTSLGAAELIETRRSGYLARINEEALDLTVFRACVTRGRAAAKAGENVAAVDALQQAMSVWRTQAGLGIETEVVANIAAALDEERLACLGDLLEVKLSLGLHKEIIAELTSLVDAYPFRENFRAQHMLALYQSGRQADALASYRNARDVFQSELGIEPGEVLKALHHRILTGDIELQPPPASQAAPESAWLPMPRQLPAGIPDFIGRTEIINAVRALSDAIGRSGTGRTFVPIAALNGPSGVGKTTLAIHIAQGLRDRFPDGQLYVSLRGADARPTEARVVLRAFLRAFGVPGRALPADLESLSALYRSVLADKRVLIMLDNAASTQQVQPLLPGEPNSMVLITSRMRLDTLAGAHHFTVSTFDRQTSVQLLTAVLGHARVSADSVSAGSLAEYCGGYPLALRVAATKLVSRPHRSISWMADRVRREDRRLDELTHDSIGIRGSIAASFSELSVSARRLLLLLTSLGGFDFSSWVCAPLSNLRTDAVDEFISELISAGLLHSVASPNRSIRFQLHDLIRIFGNELLATEFTTQERADAQRRLLQSWLHLANNAHQAEYGGDFTIITGTAKARPVANEVIEQVRVSPMAWFSDELNNLIRAVRIASQVGEDELCWQLATMLVTLFERGGYLEEWRASHMVALKAVREAGNRRGEAAVRCSLGSLAIAEQRLDAARADLEAASAYFSATDDKHALGLASRNLAYIDRLQGRSANAKARYETALADIRVAGDKAAEAHILSGLARCQMESGNVADAHDSLKEAAAICEQFGIRRVGAQVSFRLGELRLQLRDLPGARAAFDAVFREVRAAADLTGQSYAFMGLGSIDLAEGAIDAAYRHFQKSWEAAERSGDRIIQGCAQLCMARAAAQANRLPVAHAHARNAEETFRQINATTLLGTATDLRSRIATSES